MTRRLAATIGLLAGLAPAMGYAQTNIDQGKSPGQIFENACSGCHKAARGLAGGKNSAALAEFLREHYTTSREQAASLAAYVLGAGRGGAKPTAERGRAGAEDAKPAKQSGRQPAKPEEGTAPSTAKPQRPAEEESKPEDKAAAVEEPAPAGHRAGKHEKRSAARGRHKEPDSAPAPAAVVSSPPAREPAATPAAREPAAIVAEPKVDKPSPQAVPAPSAAIPPGAPPADGTQVPRDNIPD